MEFLVKVGSYYSSYVNNSGLVKDPEKATTFNSRLKARRYIQRYETGNIGIDVSIVRRDQAIIEYIMNN